jgi:hypothetical protein
VRVNVSYFYETLKIFNYFSRENHGHGGHEHGVHRGFSGVSFHSRCPQGVASVLWKKTTIFGPRRSKLDHLTVHLDYFQQNTPTINPKQEKGRFSQHIEFKTNPIEAWFGIFNSLTGCTVFALHSFVNPIHLIAS